MSAVPGIRNRRPGVVAVEFRAEVIQRPETALDRVYAQSEALDTRRLASVMTWIIVLLVVIAAIAGLSVVAARRRRFVGSAPHQRMAERAAHDAQSLAYGRGGMGGGESV
jgi:hypothetical protein